MPLVARSVVIAALGMAAITPGPAAAQAAPAAPAGGETTASAIIYWEFRNLSTGRCLSTYSSGAIRALTCAEESKAQQWQWIDSSWNGNYRLLKNRWTGLCLIWDSPYVRSGECEDWTSRHWVQDPVASGKAHHIVARPAANDNAAEALEHDADDGDKVGAIKVSGDYAGATNTWFVCERDRV